MYDFEIVTAIMCRRCGHIFGVFVNRDPNTHERTCPQCGYRGMVNWGEPEDEV